MTDYQLCFSSLPGLGADEYPGFPADVCPEELPDISKHFSIMAEILNRDPGLYKELRGLRTSLGVSFAKCIKTGMDNKGHVLIRTLGAVAADEECYEVFRKFFDAMILDRNGPNCIQQFQAADYDVELTSMPADPYGGYVLSSQICAARNIQGIRFLPAATKEDRRLVEELVTRSTWYLENSTRGDYFPLIESNSYAPKPGGMTPEQEEQLQAAGVLFCHPDSTAVLCTGTARDWPDARGVFVNTSKTFSIWVNEEEHLRATNLRPDGDVQAAFQELDGALACIAKQLRQTRGSGFARSPRLGYLTSSPALLGTAMRVSVILRIPLLQKRRDQLTRWCKQRFLVVRSAVGREGSHTEGLLEVSNSIRLWPCEVELVNNLIFGVSELVRAERRLEEGKQGLEEISALMEELKDEYKVQETVDANTAESLAMLSALFNDASAGADEDCPNSAQWSAANAALGVVLSRTVDQLCAEAATPKVQPKEETTATTAHADPLKSLMAHGAYIFMQSSPADLSAALHATFHESQNMLDAARSKVLGVLETAAKSGKLDEVLQSFRAEDEAKQTQAVEAPTLEPSAEVKLAAQPPTPLQPKPVPPSMADASSPALRNIDELRLVAKNILEGALMDGSLLQILTDGTQALAEASQVELVASCPAPVPQEPQVPEASPAPLVPEAPESSHVVAPAEPAAAIVPEPAVVPAVQPDPVVPAPQALTPVLPSGPKPLKKVPASAGIASQALLQNLSETQRKIGTLTASIREAEKRIIEQSALSTQLEAELSAARQDCRILDVEIEHRHRLLADAESANINLQEGHRRLKDEMHMENFKFRHAAVELNSTICSARSDLSTACTMYELGMTLTSPRKVPDLTLG